MFTGGSAIHLGEVFVWLVAWWLGWVLCWVLFRGKGKWLTRKSCCSKSPGGLAWTCERLHSLRGSEDPALFPVKKSLLFSERGLCVTCWCTRCTLNNPDFVAWDHPQANLWFPVGPFTEFALTSHLHWNDHSTLMCCREQCKIIDWVGQQQLFRSFGFRPRSSK